MKHIVLTLLFVVAPFMGYSQTTLHFTYDDGGHRTLRTIVVSSLQSPHHNKNTSVDLFEDTKFRIKETETNLLQIELLGLKKDANIFIFDTSGKTFLSSKISEAVSNIDVSAIPRGIYVLRIDIDGEENTWKLIKK